MSMEVINNSHQYASVSYADETTEDSLIIQLSVPLSEIQQLLYSYDQASATSPSAADSRVIARIVLDALKKVVEG